MSWKHWVVRRQRQGNNLAGSWKIDDNEPNNLMPIESWAHGHILTNSETGEVISNFTQIEHAQWALVYKHLPPGEYPPP